MKLRPWAARALAGVAVVGLGLGLAACGSSSSSSGGASSDTTGASAETTLTVGYVTTAQHPYGLALQQFADQIAKDSGGKLAIKLIPTYGGGNDLTLLDDITGGTVDGGSVSAAVWDTKGVKDFEALQMPFLVNSYALEGAVLNSPIQAAMLKGTDKVGITGVAIHEGGLRKPLSTTGCYKTPADFAGKKIRVPPAPLLSDGIQALGATPTPTALADVYLALKQGTVDGMEANLGLIFTQKFNEVTKCLTANVNFWPFPTVLGFNTAKWNSLSAEQQGWITTAAGSLDDNSLAILTNPKSTLVSDLCSAGLKFGAATPDNLTALRAAEDGVYKKYTASDPTKSFVSQIEALKAQQPAPPAPKPLPAGCAE